MAGLSYMRADVWPAAGGVPDVSPLIGTWKNCNTETDHIAKLVVSLRDSVIRVQVFGAYSPEPVDWGEVKAAPFVSSGKLVAEGFHTHYDFGPIQTLLAANQKQGILVIQSYTTFKDGSGRLNSFAREFFHQ